MVAHALTQSRTTEDDKKVFQQALSVQRPVALFTDGSFAYDDSVRKVFYTRYKASHAEWVKRVGVRARETNNIIERTHEALKHRLKPIRGLKHDKTARSWLDGYIVNFNYCRTHQAIGKTPRRRLESMSRAGSNSFGTRRPKESNRKLKKVRSSC